MSVSYSAIIDRIGITVPLTLSQYIQCNGQLWKEIKVNKGKPKQIEGGWRARFGFNDVAWAAITVAKRYGYRYLQYDFKPTELDAAAFELFLTLSSKFQNATYANALVAGKVSKLEIAIDYLFKNTLDLLVHKPGVQGSQVYFPHTGAPPTLYVGSLHSPSRYVAYTGWKDKVLGQQLLTQQVMRIEARKRNISMSPADLGDLPNQFSGVSLFSIAAAEALGGTSVKEWGCFLGAAKMVGVATALGYYPQQRKKLLTLLSQCCVPWWKPTSCVTHWKQIVDTQLRLSKMKAAYTA